MVLFWFGNLSLGNTMAATFLRAAVVIPSAFLVLEAKRQAVSYLHLNDGFLEGPQWRLVI